MDLLSVVVKPTWKEFLIELVQSRQMDPWDIDLIAVSDAYLQKVRELQALDLRVPANVILACALMLRFKADTISFEEPDSEEFYEEPALIQEELPQLVYRPNRPRRRGITLQELIKAVEQVMKQGERPVVKFAAAKDLEIDLPKADMDELMQVVYEKAFAIKDAEGVVMFSQLIQKIDYTQNGNGAALDGNGNSNASKPGGHSLQKNKADAHKLLNSYETRAEGVVYHLLPVLHLVQENKLLAWQNDFFGEIFLRIGGGQQAAAQETKPAAGQNAN